MLPAWAVVLTVAITSGSTLGAVRLQGVLGRGEAKRRERKDHEREGREAVVELAMLVRESNYMRYVMNTSQEMLTELTDRQTKLRPIEHRLLVWSAEDEDAGMPARCRELIAALDRSIFSSALVVRDILQSGPPPQQVVDRAKDHAEATRLADAFLGILGAK